MVSHLARTLLNALPSFRNNVPFMRVRVFVRREAPSTAYRCQTHGVFSYRCLRQERLGVMPGDRGFCYHDQCHEGFLWAKNNGDGERGGA